MRSWPDVLPGPSREGYELRPVDQAIRSDMEVGPVRLRRITEARRDLMTLPYRMSDAQYNAWRAWYGDEAWNLLGASDSLAAWALTGVTRSAGAVAGPETGTLADVIVEDTSTAQHRANFNASSILPAGSIAVIHATMRASGRTVARINYVRRDNTTAHAQIDLTTGAVTSTASILAAVATNRGGGWWRLRMEVDTLTGATTPALRILAISGTSTTNYTGDGVSGIAITEVSARVKSDTGDLHMRTDSTGRVLGAAGGTAWFFQSLPIGGVTRRLELRHTAPPDVMPLAGPYWQVTGQFETRNA